MRVLAGLMGLILGCISQALIAPLGVNRIIELGFCPQSERLFSQGLQPLSCLGYVMRYLVWWHNAMLNGVSVSHLLFGVGSLSVEY